MPNDGGKRRKTLALMGMAENFGKEISQELLRMWLRLLEPYDATDVEFAVLRVIECYEYKTLPPFAVLKKMLDHAIGKLEPESALEMQAQAEWAKLLRDVKELGIYKGPAKRLHPTTDFVLRSMGGWQSACQWQSDKLEWREKEFIEKWRMSHDNVAVLSLGANAIAALTEMPQSAKAILAGMAQKTLTEMEQCEK